MINIKSRIDRIVCLDLPAAIRIAEICSSLIFRRIHIFSVLPVPVGTTFSFIPSGIRGGISVYIVGIFRCSARDPGIILPCTLIFPELQGFLIIEGSRHRLCRVTQCRHDVHRLRQFFLCLNDFRLDRIALRRGKRLIAHHKAVRRVLRVREICHSGKISFFRFVCII